MANTKSARKRIKIEKRNHLKNRFYLSTVRTLSKRFYSALDFYKVSQNSKDKNNIQDLLNSIYSLIDKGTKKHVFHRNTAARKKSRLVVSFKKIKFS